MVKATIQWNTKQISRMFDNGCLHFDNIIQRGTVWDKKRMSLLIDSILRGYPIPPIYTVKTEEKVKTSNGVVSVYDCLDGKQRCHAIKAFRNNEFALEGLEECSGEGEENATNLNGLKYEDLAEALRDEFDGYCLTAYFFTDITDDEVSEVMARLNNGKPLTGIENARIKAKNLPNILKLASHDLFVENMSEAALKSYHNEDVVIKTALQVFDTMFELSTSNVKKAYETLEFTEEQTNRLDAIFDTVYCVLDEIKKNAKKSVVRRILKKTNLVNIIYFASWHIEDDTERMAEFLEKFFTEETEYSQAYDEAAKNGTNHAVNVLSRNEAMEAAYNQSEEVPF